MNLFPQISFPPLLRHSYRLHFPDSFAIGCGHMAEAINGMEEEGSGTRSRPGHTNLPDWLLLGHSPSHWPEWNPCVILSKVAELSLIWSLKWLSGADTLQKSNKTKICHGHLELPWTTTIRVRNFCEEPLQVWVNLLSHPSHSKEKFQLVFPTHSYPLDTHIYFCLSSII